MLARRNFTPTRMACSWPNIDGSHMHIIRTQMTQDWVVKHSRLDTQEWWREMVHERLYSLWICLLMRLSWANQNCNNKTHESTTWEHAKHAMNKQTTRGEPNKLIGTCTPVTNANQPHNSHLHCIQQDGNSIKSYKCDLWDIWRIAQYVAKEEEEEAKCTPRDDYQIM